MADENRPKFQFLRRGTGQTRILQRSVAINPPPPHESLSSSSDPSLPRINGLSPIPKDQPATNTRPTTAETGDSGVRDVNLPTYDSASVRTTVTTFHQKSPPNAAAVENEGNISQEHVQNFQQLDPRLPRQAAKIIPQPDTITLSPTESYTSLNRIKTPPIPTHTKPNDSISSNHSANNTPPGSSRKSAEFDKTSDFSAEIDAASRSKDSASVGTSKQHDASSEPENVHDTTFGPQNDSRYYGTSHHHHNSSLPPPQSQHYSHETPLNSRNQYQPLFKSHSSSSILNTQNGPTPYQRQQIGHRFGIPPVPRYHLPPPPRHLESPVVGNGLATPQTNAPKNRSFYRTPILPEHFVSKEEGKVVESLAEQLRALLILLDTEMDIKKEKINQLKYVYSEKSKAFQRKEQEIKLKGKEEEQKLNNAKAKLKLESDKIKQSVVDKKNVENELTEVKRKYTDTARILSDTRLAKNQMEQKLKKAEEELQKEREKSDKWKTLNVKLQKDLEIEKLKAEFAAKQKAQQSSQQEQQPRQPLRTIPSQRQNQQQQQQFQPQSNRQQQQQIPLPRRLTNASTSSEASTSKNVHWELAEDENHDVFLANENLNFASLRTLIPNGLQLLHRVDDQSFIEEQYRRMGSYRLMKECGCELIRYDNNDIRYCCLTDLKVNVSYIAEDGHLTVALPGGYIVKTFASMQLEIHRTYSNENSVVAPDGTRYEYFNVQDNENQAIEVIYKNAGERQNPGGTVENLQSLNTRRAHNDFVAQTEIDILFTCPGFKVSRALDPAYGGGVTIKVDSNDSKKFWKITICPEHQVFYVKHYNGNQHSRCFYTEKRCDHLKN